MFNIFMGQFGVVLGELLKHIPLDLVIVEDKSSNRKVEEICGENNISYVVINNYKDLLEITKDIKNINLCFVASFGIILKNEFIKKCNYLVNFHTGDVDICRGRHPLPTAILNKHKTAGITIHLIDSEEIDAGPVLAKALLPIDYSRSYKYNENRLLGILKLLTNFLMKQYLEDRKFVAYKWNNKNSVYFRPLKKEILNKIINADNLDGVLE